MDRRKFIRNTAFTGGALAASVLLPKNVLAASPETKLVILHTNDVHSRLEPFPMDGGRNQGLGGVVARAALINDIRATEEHVLLLDAGDIFQGTPYFNIYKGEPEMKAMTAMGYDACTMGNHDFDGGLDNFALQLQYARFPVIISNYDFAGTAMENKFVPWKVFKKGKLKIGITGVGIEMQGLISENLYGKTKYLDPVQKANEMAAHLKQKEKCDMVICLSHLGYSYKDNKVSDQVLAKETENIDLIIGGHSHTFMPKPDVYKNRAGADIIVNQVGWAGINLGRLDFSFGGVDRKKLLKAHTVVVGEKTNN